MIQLFFKCMLLSDDKYCLDKVATLHLPRKSWNVYFCYLFGLCEFIKYSVRKISMQFLYFVYIYEHICELEIESELFKKTCSTCDENFCPSQLETWMFKCPFMNNVQCIKAKKQYCFLYHHLFTFNIMMCLTWRRLSDTVYILPGADVVKWLVFMFQWINFVILIFCRMAITVAATLRNTYNYAVYKLVSNHCGQIKILQTTLYRRHDLG